MTWVPWTVAGIMLLQVVSVAARSFGADWDPATQVLIGLLALALAIALFYIGSVRDRLHRLER